MNAWKFDDDDTISTISSSRGDNIVRSDIRPSKRDSGDGSFQVKKHAFFAADDDSFSSEPPKSSRRKQSSSGRKELVLDDDLDANEEEPQQPQSDRSGGGAQMKSKPADTQRLQSSVNANGKADETGTPDVIHTVFRTKVPQLDPQKSTSLATASVSANTAAGSTTSKKRVSIVGLPPDSAELFMYYIVREFLRLHAADDAVVNLFEKEQSVCVVLDEKEAKKQFERIAGHKETSSRSKSVGSHSSADEKPRSLLEQFIVVWDETIHKRKCERRAPSSSSSSSSRRSSSSSSSRQSSEVQFESGTEAGAKKKSSPSSSSRKKKPMLNVVTAAEELGNVDELNNGGSDDGIEVDYNRLNHPGSTPKPQGASEAAAESLASSILGDPGSTPKARAGGLKALGFDEEEIRTPVPLENIVTSSASVTAGELDADLSNLSEYAKRKRVAKKHSKHVSLGESGSTPTKEYIFFRETPPSFVTETVEAAVDVFEKLGLDPVFRQQAAAPQERFVELQSSEVSKYKIGQEVQNLGAQRNVSGVVSKIFGSRQCGSSGPGAIVIDTCPDDANGCGLGAAPIVPVTTATVSSGETSALDGDDEDFMTELA